MLSWVVNGRQRLVRIWQTKGRRLVWKKVGKRPRPITHDDICIPFYWLRCYLFLKTGYPPPIIPIIHYDVTKMQRGKGANRKRDIMTVTGKFSRLLNWGEEGGTAQGWPTLNLPPHPFTPPPPDAFKRTGWEKSTWGALQKWRRETKIESVLTST
jgi:hypothetical protein